MRTEGTGRRSFHDELESLQQTLLEMAGVVEQLVEGACEAVLARDAKAAKLMRAKDDRIDELEVEIDERVVELLALQQPMAGDLRHLIAINKASNDLERIGDHAVNVAKSTRRLVRAEPLPQMRELPEMVTITRGMLSDVLAAYVSRDAMKARVVMATDQKVDDLRGSMFRIVLTHMLEDPRRIGGGIELLLIAQSLERIADLATNIAEDVVFLVEGRSLKHGRGPDEEAAQT